ncbi:MAG: hypothetical protein E7Z90_04170 [Cyanobacteria bacterium SIG29]|nr:hypothetical protein [Cyanobacteria bacterium SIG29]
MSVQGVNEKPTVSNILSSAILGGAVAAGAEKLLLPVEAKAALRNTRFGQDVYMKKAAKAVQKTMKNTGKKFDVGAILENAKNMYPDYQAIAKTTKKSLGKTFAGVAVAVAGAKLLAEVILNRQEKKAQQVAQQIEQQ